jgi:cobalt/nickel transport system ATP-binding protein
MPPIVELRNLAHTYPDGRQSLFGLTLQIEPGECVGLVGPNGAGKSTMMLHLNGILPEKPRTVPGDDGVWIDGEPVVHSTLRTVRSKVGLLFQNPEDQLFCPTVLEDVAFGPLNLGVEPAEARRIAEDLLDQVGLAGFEGRAPHRLSMGEKKRVCLAGVLACQPQVLVLDEPTSNLDPRGRRHFIDLIATLPVTKIIATHDLEMVVESCTRTIILDHGRIQANGPTLEILRDRDLLESHGLEVPLSLL